MYGTVGQWSMSTGDTGKPITGGSSSRTNNSTAIGNATSLGQNAKTTRQTHAVGSNANQSSTDNLHPAVAAAVAKRKATAEQIMNKAVQKWWFAAIGLLLGLVSLGFGIAMALRAEKLQRARSVAEQELQKRTAEFTSIATDFVSAIDEQEARVRDNVDRLDRLQNYWVAALEDNQRITEETYKGVRQMQQHLNARNVLPPLETLLRDQQSRRSASGTVGAAGTSTSEARSIIAADPQEFQSSSLLRRPAMYSHFLPQQPTLSYAKY